MEKGVSKKRYYEIQKRQLFRYAKNTQQAKERNEPGHLEIDTFISVCACECKGDALLPGLVCRG